MKIAVFADSHGNSKSLSKIIEQEKNKRIDRFVHLGDFIGGFFNSCINKYSVKESIRLLKKHNVYSIAGNHEESFIKYYQNICKIDKNYEINEEIINYLKKLPEELKFAELPDVLFRHKPLSSNNLLLLDSQVTREFKHMENLYSNVKIIFFGHTHISALFRKKNNNKFNKNYFQNFNKLYDISSGLNLINPGTTYSKYFPYGYNLPFLQFKPPSYVIFDSDKKEICFKKIY